MIYYFQVNEEFSFEKIKFQKGIYKTENVNFVRKYQGLIKVLQNVPISAIDFDGLVNQKISFNTNDELVEVTVEDSGDIDIKITDVSVNEESVTVEDIVMEVKKFEEVAKEINESKPEDTNSESIPDL